MSEATGRPPSVDVLARSIADVGLPHVLAVLAAREAVAAGDPSSTRRRGEQLAGILLRPVVNATGVLLHTNLGRAPLPLTSLSQASNVELDLATGKRGRRTASASLLVSALTGAEAATVVNNGAAAVLLALTVLARCEPVVVSRGELVEIGGGFRIPEVLAASGARLVEVGTTNKTRLSDYEDALTACAPDESPVVLKVHPSNYKIFGFTASVPVRQLAQLGRPVLADLGSGLLDADVPWLSGRPPSFLAGEPAARQTLADGASLVTFSGDKLLGGPQAGIIAGAADLVASCERHPLARALRPGSLVLAALQETLLAYARRDPAAISFWRMATLDVAELRQRAEAVAAAVGEPAAVQPSLAAAGAGSAPGAGIESVAVTLPGDRSEALRRHDPPVVATVHDGATFCDLRSLEPSDDPVLISALKSALAAPAEAER